MLLELVKDADSEHQPPNKTIAIRRDRPPAHNTSADQETRHAQHSLAEKLIIDDT